MKVFNMKKNKHKNSSYTEITNQTSSRNEDFIKITNKRKSSRDKPIKNMGHQKRARQPSKRQHNVYELNALSTTQLEKLETEVG